jgi:hypothetical protein
MNTRSSCPSASKNSRLFDPQVLRGRGGFSGPRRDAILGIGFWVLALLGVPIVTAQPSRMWEKLKVRGRGFMALIVQRLQPVRDESVLRDPVKNCLPQRAQLIRFNRHAEPRLTKLPYGPEPEFGVDLIADNK